MSFDPIANGWRKLLKNGGVGYTETIKTAASVTLTSKNNLMDFVPISGRPVSLVEGRTYTVSVASDDPDAPLFFPTTECVCVDMSGGAGEAFVIGNQALFDANESEDTGEWFMILEAFQEGEWMTFALWGIPSMSATDSITANVTSSTETVHTIDQKYLGGVVLPCVDIRTVPTNDPTFGDGVLTAEETAQVEKAVATGLPVIIRQIDDKDGIRAMVMMNTAGYMLQTNDGNDTFMIVNMEMMGGTGWVFGIQSTST